MLRISRNLPALLTAAFLALSNLGSLAVPADASMRTSARKPAGQAAPAAASRNSRRSRAVRHSAKSKRRRHGSRACAALPQQIGVIVMSESGETILEELSETEFNPASVAKLVTAYGAIKTLGLDHKFTTKILTDGKLDASMGTLSGNLYVQGADPDFERDDAVALRKQLAGAGLKRIEGKIFVSAGFSYASASSPLWSGRALSRVLRNAVPAGKGVAVGQAPEGAEVLTEYQSEPLRQTLKEMLSYSKNNVAEQLGRAAGGINHLEELVSRQAGIPSGSLKLASASGLGKNRVKPKDMLQVIKSLRTELQSQGLDLQDICPVAGVDGGTLDERFTKPQERGSVVAKTGTLPGTDGGASALAGMFRSQKEDYYFVIFCWRGSVISFRHQQDELIRKLQSARGGPKPFEYSASREDS